MAVHVFAGRRGGRLAPAASLDCQQRGAVVVPEQLLCKMAEQLADPRPVEPCVPVLQSVAVCAIAVRLPVQRVVRICRSQEGSHLAGVRNVYGAVAAGRRRVGSDLRDIGTARSRAERFSGVLS